MIRRRPLRGSLASRLLAVGILQLCLLIVTAAIIFIVEGPHDQARPSDHLDRATLMKIEADVDHADALTADLAALRGHRIEASLYDPDRQLIASNIEPPLAIPQRRHWGGPDGEHHDGDHHDGDHHDGWRDHDGFDGDHPPPPPPGAPGSNAGPPPPPDVAFGSNGGPPPAPPPGDRVIPEGFPHVMVIGVGMHGRHGRLVARGEPGAPPGLLGPILTIVCGFLIFGVGSLLTARWIVRPIERLSGTARALGAGELTARSGLRRGDEIGELGEVVDDMADRLGALMLAERELLANVAHELRTPLARIGVALDLAGEGDAAAARASLGEIAVDVTELQAILDDILTANRFELAAANQASGYALRVDRLEPATLVSAAAERFRARHADRPFSVELAPGLPVIAADPVMLRRVLDNLLENAHKYSPDPKAPIRLEGRATADGLVLAVVDHGIGILADDLPRIFTAFFRGDRSRSRETGGVGLGLTLARRIAEAHGGTITVDSEANQGTTVRVTIPLAA
jgi:signal transduction histidine kinase